MKLSISNNEDYLEYESLSVIVMKFTVRSVITDVISENQAILQRFKYETDVVKQKWTQS